MIAIKVLEAAEKAAGIWPTQMPGHVNFGAEAIDVDGQLEEGAHRLEGSPWQFIVEHGQIVSAVREDMKAWWREDHLVYASAEVGQAALSPEEPPPPKSPEPLVRARRAIQQAGNEPG